ncbi:uncharacterized protein LOC129589540 isoform X2 [Paramacrobiotus metropolitanus]|uniref:uncharacterized protein LOC129589540 isoform X2 n=1 Tax=Paramacrobiotus metropolitanus TaxID=2943436 RepID=UPI002445A794|nr:uncharacterized protein LOC129589540 isoform X2 [Paramacrobiotus metropolitanus]
MGVLRAFLAWLLSWIPWLNRKAVEDQRNVHPAPVLLRISDQPTGKSLVHQNTPTANINYADDEPNTDDTATLLASTTSVGLTRSAQNCSPMDFTHVSRPRPAKLPAFQKTEFVENWLQNDIAKPPKPEVGGSSLNSARKSSRASSKDSHESGNPVATDYKNVEGCPADEIGKSIIRQAADEAVQPSPTAIVTYLYRVSVYPSFKLPVVYCMDRGFPQKHRLGNGEIMPPGLEIALLHMREGEWSKFRIASKHGYGKSGKRAFDVSSTTVLYVEVELLKVQETAMADKVASEEPFFWTETFSQSELTIAQRQLWSLGKVSYEEKEYTQAIEIGTTLKVGEKR